MNETTKRHPRTTVEAFPDTERAGCCYGPYRPENPFTAGLLAIAGAIVGAILLAVVGVSG
jgi:hypothetical protein